MKANGSGLNITAINRIFWMMLFLGVIVVLAWSEWRSDSPSTMGWFLATSLWSAVCGIGYSVSYWWVTHRRGNDDIDQI